MSREEDAATLREWVEFGKPRSLLLIIAVPGSGSSTLLSKILEELDIESVWLTSATAKLRACMQDAGASWYSATGRRKVLVLEGFDALMADANSAADVGDFVRRNLPAPTICLAHRTRTISKRFQELFTAATRHRSTVLELHPLTPIQIAEVLRAQSPTLSQKEALSLATACKGDIRTATTSLSFSDVGASDRLKDDIPESFAVVDEILAGSIRTVREALDRASSDPTVISYGVFERYGSDPSIADAFSAADVLEEHMFAHQRWELADVHAAIAVGYPSVTLQPGAVLHPKRDQFTYGMVWSRLHLQAARRKLLLTISRQRAESRLGLLPVPDLGFVRRMVFDAEKRKEYGTLRQVLHGLRPDGVLAMMRLWKGGYTQSMHSRVSKNAVVTLEAAGEAGEAVVGAHTLAEK